MKHMVEACLALLIEASCSFLVFSGSKHQKIHLIFSNAVCKRFRLGEVGEHAEF